MRQRKDLDIPLPLGGLNIASAHRDQPPRTSADVQNVRPHDPRTGRKRIAQRGGLSKYSPTAVNGTNRIQNINHITSMSTGGSTNTSFSIRTIVGIAVAGGNIVQFATTGNTAVTNGTAALSATTPVIFSAEFFGLMYFADGVSAKYYNPATNTVSAWTASAGSLPSDGGNLPRLIETWRGRLVLSGISSDPQNWFMSAVSDATNFDYAPSITLETQAVAGNNSSAGKVGDPVKCLIPYNDDILIFGCDHSIWQMTGDPMSGGRIDLISDTIGIAWGQPWCKAPDGTVYFFGSRGSVYKMMPGQPPQRITADTVEEEFAKVNQDQFVISMEWNDREIGVHLFISPLTAGGSNHYFYDVRTQSWWRDTFTNVSHNPVATHVFDGDDATDRVLLIGGGDSIVRRWEVKATSDDGSAIESYVYLGPIQIEDGSEPFILSELQAVLADGSSNVTFNVYTGNSAEHVFAAVQNIAGKLLGFELSDGSHLLLSGSSSSIDYTGTFAPIRSVVANPRIRGCAMFVQIYSNALNSIWAMESLRAALSVVTSSKKRRL